ncbi:type II toxin-antitoxin system HicB family antitoxin [Actinotignum schaalii]|uniref:type II toxin-antitoxin system HicB family antitoxin n=1 Tax=Actinotignum TaxID=1653174 RepID=UPI0003F4D29C|nr:type II toxin-antitoxin system HicB family antitoxin [Actinotignum schaalii]WQN45171.1 type II toxin-antitoxin system HicB family antitoxin [Actinotignum schaalii]
MSTYTARATREEGWWVVEVDEVPGLFTQSQNLEDIPDLVRDALALFPEVERDPASARVRVILPGLAAPRVMP